MTLWLYEASGKKREAKEISCSQCEKKFLVRKDRKTKRCKDCIKIKPGELFIVKDGEKQRAKLNKCIDCGEDKLILQREKPRERCRECHTNYLHECQIGRPSNRPKGRNPLAYSLSKEYQRNINHKTYRKFRFEVVKIKGNKCFKCGKKNLPVAVYELHHRDPTQKDMTISDARAKSWEKFVEEMEKCDLVCCNCHRIIHSRFGDERIN